MKTGACNVCACKKFRPNKRTFPCACLSCGHLVYSHERIVKAEGREVKP